MKYQPGDDIIILLTKEEGKVLEIIDNRMLLVEVRGVQFPVYNDQIDFPYFQRFTSKKILSEKKPTRTYIDQIPKEKKSNKIPEKSDGVWISMVPKFSFDEFNDEVVDFFKIYLVNKNQEGYHFKYEQLFGGKISFNLNSKIEPHNDFYLHDISFENFNDTPCFSFEFTLLNIEKSKAPYFETFLKIPGKKVFKQIEEMKMKNEPSLNYRLFDIYPEALKEDLPYYDKYNFNNFQALKKIKVQPRSVVDLHIEKITDSWKGLGNFEILSIQIKEFEKWYNITIDHHLPNLIVIHGVGSGKLKEEIHELLKTKPEVKTFVNQYDSRFGFGATEIYFKY